MTLVIWYQIVDAGFSAALGASHLEDGFFFSVFPQYLAQSQPRELHAKYMR